MSRSSTRTVHIKFRVGELTLFSVARRLEVHDLAGRGEVRNPGGNPLHAASLPAGVDGALYRSVPLSDALPRISRSGRWIRYVPHQYQRYFIDLEGTYEQYLGKFSSKTRSTLRRKVRRLEKESGGSIDWKVYRSPQEMEEFHRLAREVAAYTYQEKLFNMGLPEDEAFRCELAAAAAEDRARGYLLFLDGAPVSYLYCPVRDGGVEYAYLGYLREHHALSPGTVLLLLAIEDLFAERKHRFFDFTEGGRTDAGGHKRLFSTGSRLCADLYLLRPTPSNWLMVLGHAGTDALSAAIGSVLQRLGLKVRVKRLLRALAGT